jgi:hypothetical protein
MDLELLLVTLTLIHDHMVQVSAVTWLVEWLVLKKDESTLSQDKIQ